MLREGTPQEALGLLTPLHPADRADLLEVLPEARQRELISSMGCHAVAEVLPFLQEDPRRRIAAAIPPEELGCILDSVDPSLAAELVRDMPDRHADRVLEEMEDPQPVERLLEFPEDSAGAGMTEDVLALRGAWTVDDAIRYLRERRPDVEAPFYLYIVDSQNRLRGVLSLRHLITSPPEARLETRMHREVLSVQASADREEAAQCMRHYGLMALPVVDDEGALLGVLTADDLLEVQAQEATEDLVVQTGVDADASLLNSTGTSLRRRAPWLVANLGMGALSALIVSSFDATIAKVAALAAFMPLIAGHGGNTGSQTSALVLRQLALGEWRPGCLGPILRKELQFAVLYGLLAGVLTAGLAMLLTGNVPLAGLVFLAMAGNVVLGDLAGILLPLALRRMGFDPAMAANMWLTTLTDWIGFLLLLGLGAALLT